MAKKRGTQQRMIAKILRQEGRPMTAREITEKISYMGYKMVPTVSQVSNIVKSNLFQRTGYVRNTGGSVSLWYIKEDEQND